MSYVVLARKYRPMRFADMIGQEHIGRTLGNAIKQDRVHHAYLFAGARGLGKTTTARIFAKGLVCQKGPTPEPCNECTECVAVSEGRSVDVMEIDGASNNSVDNIRSLREQVHYLPQTARRKVYIIDEVHMLTTSAFNALLKTLEEPPAHVNFVFATTEPHKVLPTILSRVNRLDFKRVAPGLLVDHLRSILDKEGFSVDEDGLRIVARAGGGTVRDALTMLDQVIAFAEDPGAIACDEVRRLLGQADVGVLHELVDAILERDPATTMQRFEALVVAGNDLAVLSLQVLEHLRDLAVIKVCDTPQVLPDATEAELAQLRATAAKVEAGHLGQLFDRFSRIVDRLPQSRSQRLLIEMGLLDLACAEPLMPLGDLVEQLQALGRGAPPPSGGGGGGASRARETRARRPSQESRSRRTSASAPASAPAPASALPTKPSFAGPPPDRSGEMGAARPNEGPPSFEGPPLEEPPEHVLRSPEQLAGPPAPAPNELRFPSAAPTSPREATPARPPATSPPSAPTSNAPPLNSFTAKLLDMARDSGVVTDSPAPAHSETAHSETAHSEPAHSEPTSARPAAPNGARHLHAVPEDQPSTNPSPLLAPAMGVGPCTPRPPADGVVPWEELSAFEAWDQLVERIRQGDEFLAAVLGELGLIELAGGVLRTAAPRGSFAHTELNRHPQMRAQVEQACRDHLGAPFTVELIEGEPVLPDLPSLVLVAQQRRAKHRAEMEAEADVNPGIQSLLSTFDGQLTGTKPVHDA